MRTIVIDKDTNLPSLMQRLANGNLQSQPLTESLKRLNPHVNFDNLTSGTLLLVDDSADVAGGVTQAPTTPQIDLLASQLRTALDSTFSDALGALQTQALERKAVTDVMKTPAMKRVIEADAGLKNRAGIALDEMKKEQAQLKESEKAHTELHGNAAAELDRLTKLVRQ